MKAKRGSRSLLVSVSILRKFSLPSLGLRVPGHSFLSFSMVGFVIQTMEKKGKEQSRDARRSRACECCVAAGGGLRPTHNIPSLTLGRSLVSSLQGIRTPVREKIRPKTVQRALARNISLKEKVRNGHRRASGGHSQASPSHPMSFPFPSMKCCRPEADVGGGPRAIGR
jgi:hypothetical protein